MSTIHRVGVIGAGTMGNGIAQASAVAGLHVVMVDVNEAAVLRGLSAVTSSLDRLHKKDKITVADKDAALARIRGTTDYADLKPCDVVIEAATENEELKHRILKQVDVIARSETILASNTSSISITRLAAIVTRPDRFVGHALLQSGADDGAGRGDPRHADVGRDGRRDRVAREAPGQDADRRAQQPGLRCEPAPVPDAERGGVRAAGAPRDGGADRRGDEARLRSSDRTARARPTWSASTCCSR